MILYHGSFMPVERPVVLRTNVGRDFGFAFYTTDLQEQAERWAWRRAKIERLNGKMNCQAVVSVYDFDDAEARRSLKWKDFPNADLPWLDLVLACRADKNYCHGFDVVSGKIANDKVGETVSFVQQGIMRKEDALERLKFQRINNQLALCTEAALGLLKYQRNYVVVEEPQR